MNEGCDDGTSVGDVRNSNTNCRAGRPAGYQHGSWGAGRSRWTPRAEYGAARDPAVGIVAQIAPGNTCRVGLDTQLRASKHSLGRARPVRIPSQRSRLLTYIIHTKAISGRWHTPTLFSSLARHTVEENDEAGLPMKSDDRTSSHQSVTASAACA